MVLYNWGKKRNSQVFSGDSGSFSTPTMRRELKGSRLNQLEENASICKEQKVWTSCRNVFWSASGPEERRRKDFLVLGSVFSCRWSVRSWMFSTRPGIQSKTTASVYEALDLTQNTTNESFRSQNGKFCSCLFLLKRFKKYAAEYGWKSNII